GVLDLTGKGYPSVLMAQGHDKKLVYYTIEVNDVYAYFLTASKVAGSGIQNITFPITRKDLENVAHFAGVDHFPNPDMLAVAIKFSWIKTEGLKNIDNYITTMAKIPRFDNTNDKKHWVRNGWEERPRELALVGMHIAFAAQGHPELLWTTFEHID